MSKKDILKLIENLIFIQCDKMFFLLMTPNKESTPYQDLNSYFFDFNINIANRIKLRIKNVNWKA